MTFAYQETVRLESGGWVRIDARAADDQKLSRHELSFVVSLAERCLDYERDRLTRKAHALAEEQRKARQREMPLCWPGFRPSADTLIARRAGRRGHGTLGVLGTPR